MAVGWEGMGWDGSAAPLMDCGNGRDSEDFGGFGTNFGRQRLPTEIAVESP